ncbi:phospholipid carrier-dependent glycosyltransferase [Candidatus Poribacteria bacterium]|nr:phospholipid carrier-dependent glycosyltransferase [Candidatus Poribacteria bacterium]
MPDNGALKKTYPYIPFGVLAAWAGLVMLRFYREHPLGLKQFYGLILRLQIPPPPSDFPKIVIAGRHLSLACLLVFVGILAGRRLLRTIGIVRVENPSGSKWLVSRELVLAFGLGWGFLIYLTFLLGAVGGLYSAVMWGVILLLLGVCVRDIPCVFRDLAILLRRDKSPSFTDANLFADGGRKRTEDNVRTDSHLKQAGQRTPPQPGPDAQLSERPLSGLLERVGSAAVIVMLILIAIMALAPSITHDAMVYHLDVPRIYTQEHGFKAVPYNLFSNTFLNMEMLYVVALLIDDFILANLIHYILGVATLVLFCSVIQSNFGRSAAVLTALIFFFNPPFLNQMPLAYGDIGMAFYFVLALYSLWRWKTEGAEGWFALACVFAGVFSGMKYTAMYGLFTMCVMIAAAELSSGERRVGKAIKRLALFGAVVTVFVSPYLIKNYLITGNPVYPVMYNLFDGRWLSPLQVVRMLEYVHSHGMGHDWRHMLALPWNITIFGNSGFANFDTAITPLWLILLPAFVFIRPKPAFAKWAALACGLYFLSWAASTHITRYMMPIFPLLSFLCAFTIVKLSEKASAVSGVLSAIFEASVVLMCGLVWFSFTYFYPPRVPAEFGPAVWGSQTRDEFLTRKIPNYPVFRYISEDLPPDARLIFFWDNRGFFCNKPKIGDSVIEAPMMIELVHEAGTADAFHHKLKAMGITHMLFNTFFLERFPTHRISMEDDIRFAGDLAVFRGFLREYCVPLFSSMGATVYALRD